MGLLGVVSKRVVRLIVWVVSMTTMSVIAFGLDGCGGGSEPTSTATQAQTSKTTPTPNPAPDAGDFLGATLTSATAGEPGVVVQSVRPDSKSQLKRGDVIVAFNGTAVASSDQLIHAIGAPKVGEQFTIKVVRGSDRFTLTEVQSPTAYLGANVKDAGGKNGATVDSVVANSPAAVAGLQSGDVITAVDDTPVGSVDDLLQVIGTHRPGDTIRLTVSRGSRQLDRAATLATRPTEGTGH